mmetsp:Transcript_21221/g.45988  ORF Transcript_21221/g.45988 Transcript_21221/m.45988 type:complete len:208 (+) Transcript_21221:83-706(+)
MAVDLSTSLDNSEQTRSGYYLQRRKTRTNLQFYERRSQLPLQPNQSHHYCLLYSPLSHSSNSLLTPITKALTIPLTCSSFITSLFLIAFKIMIVYSASGLFTQTIPFTPIAISNGIPLLSNAANTAFLGLSSSRANPNEIRKEVPPLSGPYVPSLVSQSLRDAPPSSFSSSLNVDFPPEDPPPPLPPTLHDTSGSILPPPNPFTTRQ